MTKTNASNRFTIPLQIPAYWTPEQAFAVFELVNDLREAIWRCYAPQLQEEYRDHFQNHAAEQGPSDPDDPPF
jgi:hypothetical protein